MWKERIKRTQIRRLDVHIRRAGNLLSALHHRQDFFRRDGLAGREEPAQHVVHHVEPFVLGGMQDLQVLLDRGLLTGPRQQLVVGHPKAGRGIQMVHVFVVDESARFADQRIDHVAKVDSLLALSKQPRYPFQALVPVPEFEMVLVNQHVHFQADVFAAHRIAVPLDTQHAIRFDRDTHRRESAHPLVRQRFQCLAFFSEDAGPRVVAPRHELPEESHVFILAGEVATATQTQRLIKPRFQMTMRRFDVAVLVRLADVDAVTAHAIVSQQPLVLGREFLVTGKVVHRRRKAVATNSPGHAARTVQGVLKTRRQRFERLRVTEVDVFPVGIGEDRVEQHVVVGTSPKGDPQSVQDDEVEGDHVSRMMHLRKVDFLLNPVLQFPLLNAPFQGSANRIGDPHLAWLAGRRIVFLFQPVQQREGPEAGIVFQEFLDLRPERLEGIFPSSILPWRPLPLAGQYAGITILSNGSLAHLQPPCNIRH